MSLVVDASVVVAAATSSDPIGDWAGEVVSRPGLAAPQLLPVEVTSALRRLVVAGALASTAGREILDDVELLGLELYPFEPLADRVWQLRDNLTPYDAWYVALAEAHDCPLATLDHRLVAAVGPRCDFLTPTG